MSAETVLSGLDAIRPDLEEFYRDLHAHPELGHQEERTASRVAERLRACGYEVHERIGGTGVAGVPANGDGLFRADMDAWSGTCIALFQPAEEPGDGARAMIADGLAGRIPKPEVCPVVLSRDILPQDSPQAEGQSFASG